MGYTLRAWVVEQPRLVGEAVSDRLRWRPCRAVDNGTFRQMPVGARTTPDKSTRRTYNQASFKVASVVHCSHQQDFCCSHLAAEQACAQAGCLSAAERQPGLKNITRMLLRIFFGTTLEGTR